MLLVTVLLCAAGLAAGQTTAVSRSYVVHKMTSYARAFVYQVSENYPLGPQAVTCDFLTNTYCPILEGEIVKYTLRFFIQPFFPTFITPFLEFRVEDEARVPLLCTRFSLRVVPPLNPLTANSTILNLVQSGP